MVIIRCAYLSSFFLERFQTKTFCSAPVYTTLLLSKVMQLIDWLVSLLIEYSTSAFPMEYTNNKPDLVPKAILWSASTTDSLRFFFFGDTS